MKEYICRPELPEHWYILDDLVRPISVILIGSFFYFWINVLFDVKDEIVFAIIATIYFLLIMYVFLKLVVSKKEYIKI